jgi:hypothetical protein
MASPSGRTVAATSSLLGSTASDHHWHAGGNRAERRAGAAVDHGGGRVAQHALLRHPALDPDVVRRVRQRVKVEVAADGEQHAHRKLARRLVPGGVVETVRVGLHSLVEPRGEDAEIRRAPQEIRTRIGPQALRLADRVDRAGCNPERELFARREADGHTRVRDAVQLARQGRAVLVGVAQHGVGSPFLARSPQPRKGRRGVEPPEDLADHHLVRLLGR